MDVGGGTGGFAVPFAALGHRVTVVDPSPDALAAAQRRAAEVRVALTAVQGDAGELASLVGDGAADLVICHSVLEYVDSPAAAMAAIARVLRPGAHGERARRERGGRRAAARARRAVRRGAAAARRRRRRCRRRRGHGVTAPRRFTLAGLTALIEGAGLRAGDAHGIRVFAGLLPGAAAPGPAPLPPTRPRRTRCAPWRRRRPPTRRCAT